MDRHRLPSYLQLTERYLQERLLPFWKERLWDEDFGGFHADYDRDGHPADFSEKTLLCQARVICTLSLAGRLGYGWPGMEELLRRGIEFLDRRFHDRRHGGYFWIVSRDGRRVVDESKVVYGLSFLIYGFAEHALYSGDPESRRKACRLFELLLSRAADIRCGGFHEHFDRRFQAVSVYPGGGWHKSLDVHMHLMEAFTSLYELTREWRHRQALEQVIGLIFDRMIDPAAGAGISMFTPDWQPLPNRQLQTVWGSDRFDAGCKGPQITSYGHNVELAWLYLHAADRLESRGPEAAARAEPLFRHTLERGVDREYGGLYVEGVRDGEVTDTDKEFWQQAEALVGFLAAYRLTGDDRYLEAFRNIHDFVFAKVVHTELGEWFALLSREGKVLRDYLGSHWKICYHTIRATVLVCEHLKAILHGGSLP